MNDEGVASKLVQANSHKLSKGNGIRSIRWKEDVSLIPPISSIKRPKVIIIVTISAQISPAHHAMPVSSIICIKMAQIGM